MLSGRLIVYRDMSKELEIEQMKAEVLRLRNELETVYSFDGIIGKSKKMQDVFALMQQAAESNITVLIRGESGTGKELVARSIHFNSRRKAGPFIAVDCAAIPETLIESELFGHERGAFTGASTRRIGKFESAQRRHNLLGRNRRNAARVASQVVTGATGTGNSAPGRYNECQYRHTRDRGNQQRP